MDLATAHKILSVNPASSQENIRETYKNLIKKWHPDKHDTNEKKRRVGEEKSKYINQAYRYLTTHRTWNKRKTGTKSANRSDTTAVWSLQNILVTTIQILFIFCGLPFLLFWNHPLHSDIFPFLHQDVINQELHFDESKITISLDEFLTTYDREYSILENPQLVNTLFSASTLQELMDSLFILYTSASYELVDLDRDGEREMILKVYSDPEQKYQQSLLIFTHSEDFSYTLVDILEGGAVLDYNSGDFYQPITTFRKFYFCDSCTISPALTNLDFYSGGSPRIKYQFKKGRLTYSSAHRSGNSEIINTLKFLKSRGIPLLNTENFDDGTRRAFAETLTRHYYSNFDLNKVRQLFYKYYIGRDKHRVWSGIISELILKYPVKY